MNSLTRVFEKFSQIIHRRANQSRINEIEKGANVDHIKGRLIDGFRHSNVTNLVNSNMAINKVSSMAGHSDPNVTLQTYTHNYKEEDNRAEIEVANKHLIS